MPCCSSDGCSSTAVPPDGRYRRILMVALAINLALFLGEVAAGLASGSVSLQADALDFLADSANYAISLFVLTKTLQLRARASLVKGLCMAGFGAWVVGSTVWHALHASLPVASTMGLVGVVALLANGAVFGLLWAYRSGDSNMRSAWICSRNDVLGNLAVLLAALGVFGTGRGLAGHHRRRHHGRACFARCRAGHPTRGGRTPPAGRQRPGERSIGDVDGRARGVYSESRQDLNAAALMR